MEPFPCLILAGDPETSIVALAGNNVPTLPGSLSLTKGLIVKAVTYCHFSLTLLDSLTG